jgi:hypothetical protein
MITTSLRAEEPIYISSAEEIKIPKKISTSSTMSATSSLTIPSIALESFGAETKGVAIQTQRRRARK